MIKLKLSRQPSMVSCTIGELVLDGEFFCHTLEDVVREVAGEPVESWKVKGKTAIPQGIYQVAVTHSPRFNCQLPLLIGVPGFEGVRIHPGNTDADTDGCILVGQWVSGESISHSRDAFNRLMEKLYGQQAEIEIINA